MHSLFPNATGAQLRQGSARAAAEDSPPGDWGQGSTLPLMAPPSPIGEGAPVHIGRGHTHERSQSPHRRAHLIPPKDALGHRHLLLQASLQMDCRSSGTWLQSPPTTMLIGSTRASGLLNKIALTLQCQLRRVGIHYSPCAHCLLGRSLVEHGWSKMWVCSTLAVTQTPCRRTFQHAFRSPVQKSCAWHWMIRLWHVLT